jgi:hypothetical protein
MKRIILLALFAAAMAVCGYTQNTPPHAASAKTWTVGEQTWSDVIHMPECNKEIFKEANYLNSL